MTDRGARCLREWYHARILIPPTPVGMWQIGKERGVVDLKFVGRDSHNVAVSGVHIANVEEVLTAAEEEYLVDRAFTLSNRRKLRRQTFVTSLSDIGNLAQSLKDEPQTFRRCCNGQTKLSLRLEAKPRKS